MKACPLVPGDDGRMIALAEIRITDGEGRSRAHAHHKESLPHPAILAAIQRFGAIPATSSRSTPMVMGASSAVQGTSPTPAAR